MPQRAARLLSTVFQPMLTGSYLLLTLALTSPVPWPSGLAWGVGLAAITAGIPFVDIIMRMRRSTVDDLHIYVREQRIRPLLVALTCTALGYGLGVWLSAPSAVRVGLLTGLVAGVVLTAITTVWKISFHAAVAASAGVLLVWALGPWALTSVPLAIAIAWSRLALRRHSLAQVLAGSITGLGLTLAVLALHPHL